MRGDSELGFDPRGPIPARSSEPDHRRLEITVLFTEPEATLAALRTAAALAGDLGAQIRLLAVQVVPYPAPLDSPAAPVSFTTRRLRSLAAAAAARTRIELYLCRDSKPTLRDCLKPQSLLVVGARRRWWPSREERLARWLEAMGHKVIVAVLGDYADATHSGRKRRGSERRPQSA